MSRIISDEEFKTFTVLLRSDIDRLNQFIEESTDEDTQDLIDERDRLVEMCERLGVNSV